MSRTADLIPVRAYAAIAARLGVRESDRTLAMTGRLVKVTVGRSAYYPLAEIVAAAPGPRYPVIIALRADLAGQAHTITVERVDPATARAWAPLVTRWRPLIGRRAVVERHDGRLGKVVAIEGVDGMEAIVTVAVGTARVYGARYVAAEVAAA